MSRQPVAVDAGDSATLPDPARRRGGRTRSAEATAVIIDATVSLLAELGYDGTSMDAIAARARASKPTIYRRWASKEELVLEALGLTIPTLPVPDTGDLRTDLTELAANYLAMVSHPRVGRLYQAIVSQVPFNEVLAAFYRDMLVRRRADSGLVLRRAIERGELPKDTDTELLFNFLAGAINFTVATGLPMDPDLPERMADALLEGFKSERRLRLPGARRRRADKTPKSTTSEGGRG